MYVGRVQYIMNLLNTDPILAFGKFCSLFFGFSAFFCYLCPRFWNENEIST